MRRAIVVIPALNEATTIANLVEACRQHPIVAGVIVIDDGSTDSTMALARRAGAQVLRHGRRCGKGASLMDGFAAALAEGAEVIVTMDGDGQHRPSDIAPLLKSVERYRDAIIIGSRRAGAVTAPPARRIANRIADFWVSWAARQWIDDTQSGFRAYPAEIVRYLRTRNMPRGFGFDSAALIDAGRNGVSVRSIPIPAKYNTARASHFRPISDVTQIVLLVAARLLARGMDPAGLWRLCRGTHGKCGPTTPAMTANPPSRTPPGSAATSNR